MSIVRQGSLKNNVKCLIACAVFSAGFCFLSNSNSFAKEEKKQDIEHYNIQAKIAYNNGKYEEALGWWDKTIAADPENKEALSQVKKVRLKLDQIKEKKEKRSPRKEAAASVAQGQKQVLPELPAKPVIEIAPASEATREPEKKTGTSAVEEPKKADGAVPAAVTEPAKTTAPVKEAASKAAEGQPRAVANKTAIPAQKLLVPANAAQENSKSAIQAGKERKVEAYIAEGKVYYGQRRFSWAISEWQKALKLDPSNKTVTGYIERAGERIKKKDQGKLPLEIDMLSGAAKANALAAADKSQTPDIAWENEEGLKQTIERYTSEGKKYYGQHHFEWAISEWRKALKLDPTNKTVSGYIDRAQERLTKKTQDKGPLLSLIHI